MEINPTQQPAVAATRPARRAAPRLLLATLVALPLPLAACSTQTEAPPAPLPMPSVNTTAPASSQPSDQSTQATPVPSGPSQTPLLPEQIQAPVPSDVAFENSADGAEAYAYFLFQAWWYLINTHDIEWWDTNIPDCEWKTTMKEIAQAAISEGSVDNVSVFYPTTHERVRNRDDHNEHRITLRAEVGPIERVTHNGSSTVVDQPAKRELVFRGVHTGDGWQILGVVVRTVSEP
ncbi:DUF6318 family protein [Buchananella felis]|uniref:DUF6318 family protein n=1 Tax=Buchananella felis TaxID=3231492 RepID=UPI0035296F94